MRWILCLVAATTFGACASGEGKLGDQPSIEHGTTVIALSIQPVTSPSTNSCQAKLSRDPAQVNKGKPVIWEIVDSCNDTPEPIEIRFTAGELRQHLTPIKKDGTVGKKKPDYLKWHVGKNAQSGQYAEYGIYLNNVLIGDPRIQVP